MEKRQGRGKVRNLEIKLPSQNLGVNLLKGKSSSIYLIPYVHTTGLVTRSSCKSKLIGYCSESPVQVLEVLFPRYHVTNFNGYEFFGSGDFEDSTPMLGLGIIAIEPVFGINGTLKKLIKLEELAQVKRDKPIDKKDVQRIIKYLNQEDESIYERDVNIPRRVRPIIRAIQRSLRRK